MIGLDTNVLVRYIAQDDPGQAAAATALIESLSADAPGFVTLVSAVELVWVLKACYGANRDSIAEVLETLLRTKELIVERNDVVWQALRRYRDTQADFADCLIERCAHAAGCEYVVTFDRMAVRDAGMRLIGQGHPPLQSSPP